MDQLLKFKFKYSLRIFLSLILFVSSSCFASLSIHHLTSTTVSHPRQPFPENMQTFINQMVTQQHFDRAWLNHLMMQAEILPPVIKHLEAPMEAKNWDFYRHFFITSQRVKGGVTYIQRHPQPFRIAEKKYGVPASVITAIIGVESNYGALTNHYQELGALTTLAFYHQARAAFFQDELKQFLLLTREYQLPVLAMRGSYAGALGIPQFMPSSYRRYAVSYTGARKIDLLNNHNDAILSIANYLQKAGWQAGQPIAVPVKLTKGIPPAWAISTKAKPYFPMSTFTKLGIQIPIKVSPTQSAALIQMRDTGGYEYWIVFNNFYSIMRYNPNTDYALAVFQLSQIIHQKYEQQAKAS